ncbi:amidophosphoribosyltransferase [Pontibacter ummariensis]|uniref:Amidophosphoribosyltransferase n=1 Tax=Pontibacter ummariensis TaxID=1610492 RepID=A0A239EYQ0_9BACT|nr:amidophosphoribosyltransferase [Pontibacter ummariensis]PRY12687.1 amidophosphoribosyltransferase [Pontibacter ummariensis]SNS49591.1 amidophosphoribosyltransferase [Pontibacter ummariensis]
MSDAIKHECGIALIRLRKPISYYVEKYGTPMYGVNKLYLLMQKQHNRGQDGAGVASIKINALPGIDYISRFRSVKTRAIDSIFGKIGKEYKRLKENQPELTDDTEWVWENMPFLGDVYLGHLRYGTHGINSVDSCHPMVRENNWRSRSLAVAGNFNMTNVDEQFQKLLELGQHPKHKSDTITVLEKIGHFLDEENQALFDEFKKGNYTNKEITQLIESELDLQRVLKRACKDFDGGYAMVGLTGYGASFVVRDPNGIRPAYYYADDEIVVVASEKPAIKTAFDIDYSEIKPITPGHALIIDKAGNPEMKEILPQGEKLSCSFERIYFSRGNDPEIYEERKNMGRLLCPQILEAINYDLKNTVFSYIPNTAETSWLGMMKGIEQHLREYRKKAILNQQLTEEQLDEILQFKPRAEKLVIKDAKLRTFISDNDSRDDLVTHVYDTTYEVVKKGVDTLVVLDDSIVRGTTLEKSIIKMLDKLEPKKIIIVSCAPQIRYPDCYGIDMSRMKEFVAFRALLELLKDRGLYFKVEEVYDKCVALAGTPAFKEQNYVQELYDLFTAEEISAKVSEIVKAPGVNAEVEVIYQRIEDLHQACPNHKGDWYFTGNYPTPGGTGVVNRAFMNFMENKLARAY